MLPSSSTPLRAVDPKDRRPPRQSSSRQLTDPPLCVELALEGRCGFVVKRFLDTEEVLDARLLPEDALVGREKPRKPRRASAAAKAAM
mmetsp:Transcript_67371/g.208872  ORF Transcript_67371/g.208872 Transcript_67371/m.208872 type:complete len:88 (-) Transcript_67371:1420-1683(-)